MPNQKNKLFIGGYRTRICNAHGMARVLAGQWVDACLPTAGGHERRALKLTIHRVQPRRKSVYLALLIMAELVKLDAAAAGKFVNYMNHNRKD